MALTPSEHQELVAALAPAEWEACRDYTQNADEPQKLILLAFRIDASLQEIGLAFDGLRRWWDHVEALIVTVEPDPGPVPDATAAFQRLVEDVIGDWFRTRDNIEHAIVERMGFTLPRPEMHADDADPTAVHALFGRTIGHRRFTLRLGADSTTGSD